MTTYSKQTFPFSWNPTYKFHNLVTHATEQQLIFSQRPNGQSAVCIYTHSRYFGNHWFTGSCWRELKPTYVTFKYFFHEWLPKQKPWLFFGWFFFFIFRPNYFVFRLSQSRAWCCQVSVWCFLSFCSTLRYLFECSVVPCALCWVAALISYECTKHLTSRYWKIVSRQIPGFCNKLRRFFRMIQHQNVFCLWHWNCSRS